MEFIWNSYGIHPQFLQFPQSSELNSQSQASGTTRSLSSPLGRPYGPTTPWLESNRPVKTSDPLKKKQLLLHGLQTIRIGILWTTGDIDIEVGTRRTSRSRRIRTCLLQGRWFSGLERITFPGWFLTSKRVWSPECNKWLRVVTGTHGSLLLLATTCQSNPTKQDWTSGPIGLLQSNAARSSSLRATWRNLWWSMWCIRMGKWQLCN